MEECFICKNKSDDLFGKKIWCSKPCYDKFYYQKNRYKYIQNSKKWAKLNPERAKIIRKKAFYKFYNNKRERFNELMRRDYKRNKEKHYARKIAIRKIKIPLNYKCIKCKISNAVERHHPDYSKPLEVELLCKPCHSKQ